jgi:hypothetical protein
VGILENPRALYLWDVYLWSGGMPRGAVQRVKGVKYLGRDPRDRLPLPRVPWLLWAYEGCDDGYRPMRVLVMQSGPAVESFLRGEEVHRLPKKEVKSAYHISDLAIGLEIWSGGRYGIPPAAREAADRLQEGYHRVDPVWVLRTYEGSLCPTEKEVHGPLQEAAKQEKEWRKRRLMRISRGDGRSGSG